MSRMARAVDGLVATLFPAAAVSRAYHRDLLALIKNGEKRERKREAKYAAATSPRTTGGWFPLDSGVNTVIGNSLYQVRARVRQLCRDFPFLARAVNVSVDYVVGEGIQYQARIKTGEGKLDKRRNTQIEDAFKFWCDEADYAGKLHFYEIMQLAKRQDLEAGEFLIVKKWLPPAQAADRYLPFCLQVFEGDWLTDLNVQPASPDNTVAQGVEYETASGRVMAYHLSDPDGYGKAIRVLAADVLHGFRTLRPGQLRGISPFAPGVLLAHDLQDMMDAELDGAKLASKWLAFVKSADPTFRQTGVGAQPAPAGDKKIEELENGIIEYLRPHEDVVLASNPRPGQNFPPFVKLILTMFSVVAEVPYELLSGNYDGLNYAVSRMVRNDFAHQLRPVAARHVRQFCMRTFKPFLETAVLAGRLALPNYSLNPARYMACEWMPPGMESIDPLRESKARIDEIKAGLRSPQEHIAARGRDAEDVLEEIALFKAMADEKELDLDLFAISTSVSNNPAAVADDQDAGPGSPRSNGKRKSRDLNPLLEHFLTEAIQ